MSPEQQGDADAPERAPLRVVEVAAVCALWAFFAFLNVLFVAFTGRDADTGAGGPGLEAQAPHVILPVAWALLTLAVLWVGRFVRLDMAFWRRRAVVVIGIGIVTAVGVDLVTDAVWDSVVPARFAPGGGTVSRRFRPGMTNLTWLDDFGVFLAAMALATTRGYVLREQTRRRLAREGTAALRAEAARLHSELIAARLDALQRQMQPHFLFNTLNAVSALVERDPHAVRQMLAQLSELLRHSMSTTTPPEIALRQEIALLQRYTDIMQVRFAEQLRVSLRVADDTLEAMVPNLILQPLVENAIRHGVEQRAGGGRIIIETRREHSTLVLRVHDEGASGTATRRRPSSRDDGGLGLQNTASRLAQLYGEAHALTLTADPDGGTVAEIRIPFQTEPRLIPGTTPPELPHA